MQPNYSQKTGGIWDAGFYVPLGIIIFAVSPALQAESFGKAVLLGALFGFFAYATYDFTNLATVKNWPVLVTVVDLIWGTVLTGSVAAVSYYLGKTFLL